MSQSRLTVVPCTLEQANRFVVAVHRHHGRLPSHKLSLAVADADGLVRGVAIINRPANHYRDDGCTLEVVRVATDGCENACSALYGASARVARHLGYRRIGTYTLASEPGTSLRAAGWTQKHETRGLSLWSIRPGRHRTANAVVPKVLWEVEFPAARTAVTWPDAETTEKQLALFEGGR